MTPQPTELKLVARRPPADRLERRPGRASTRCASCARSALRHLPRAPHGAAAAADVAARCSAPAETQPLRIAA